MGPEQEKNKKRGDTDAVRIPQATRPGMESTGKPPESKAPAEASLPKVDRSALQADIAKLRKPKEK
jgi:hypothetical protein